jgi:hypothetical protein
MLATGRCPDLNPMKMQLTLPLLILLLTATAAAHADTMYKCTDDSGVVLYTNQKGTGKNCTVLGRDQSVSSVPASRSASRSTSPGDFPRVDGETQRGRDGDRRKILEQELATELENVDKSKAALAEQESIRNGDEKNYQRVLDRLQPFKDAVALHERNVEALRREMGNLK